MHSIRSYNRWGSDMRGKCKRGAFGGLKVGQSHLENRLPFEGQEQRFSGVLAPMRPGFSVFDWEQRPKRRLNAIALIFKVSFIAFPVKKWYNRDCFPICAVLVPR